MFRQAIPAKSAKTEASNFQLTPHSLSSPSEYRHDQNRALANQANFNELLEEKFNIELGHVSRTAAENPADYYPQFEQDVRREAAAMAKHYELFYCLEQAIRKLISEAMQESAGSDWWNSGKIPTGIVKEVADRIQKEMDSGVTRRSDDAIDYTTFGELSVVITSNWDLFGTIFTSRRAVEKVMNSLNVLRGPIAHCCPLSVDEVDRLQLTVNDWFRIIG